MQKYLKPIKWNNLYVKALQVLEWAKDNKYNTYQVTHNIMFNIDAIMSLDDYGNRIYTFDDKSYLIEQDNILY